MHKRVGTFIKGRGKRRQKKNWENSAYLRIEKGIWKIDEKKSNEPNKNDQVQRLGNKYKK